MRILINASNLKLGGAVQVADSFLSQLLKFPGHYFVVVLSPALKYLEDILVTYVNVRVYIHQSNITWAGIFWGYSKFLDSLVREHTIEVAFTIFGPPLWKPMVPHVVGFARPQLIYPDSPFFLRMNWARRIRLYFLEQVKLLNFKICSDALIVETKDVEKKLSALLSNRLVYTVTNNINQVFCDENLWNRTIKLDSFKGFTLLTISADYPHKNLKIIPKVIIELRRLDPDFSFRFVITQTEAELPIDEECRPYVVFLGRINVYQCPFLYEQVNAMFLPTLLECFSASYPEAMYMKCPILTSDLPFAHSLCGTSAVYFNPMDPTDIAQKILSLARNRDLQKSLILSGEYQLRQFDNPSMRAEKYIQIIEQQNNR